MRERLGRQIARHPLCREIAATIVANELVNRAGITFATDLRAASGRTPADIARAYLIVRRVFDLPGLWTAIEALDNRVAAGVQTQSLLDIAGVVEHAALWLLRAGRFDIDAETARFAPAIRYLAENGTALLPPAERALYDERAQRLAADGVPPATAVRLAGVIFLTTALEIGELATRTAQPIAHAAETFYRVGARFAFDELRDAARRLPAQTAWQKAGAATLVEDFYGLQADFAERVLRRGAHAADPLTAWAEAHAAALAPAEAVTAELGAAAPDFAMLVVAARRLRQAIG